MTHPKRENEKREERGMDMRTEYDSKKLRYNQYKYERKCKRGEGDVLLDMSVTFAVFQFVIFALNVEAK